MSSPINKVKFVEKPPVTLDELIDTAIRKGADKKSIDIFLEVIKEKDCALVDDWDTYITD